VYLNFLGQFFISHRQTDSQTDKHISTRISGEIKKSRSISKISIDPMSPMSPKAMSPMSLMSPMSPKAVSPMSPMSPGHVSAPYLFKKDKDIGDMSSPH